MYSKELAISVRDISKCYQIYANPTDRLRQFVVPRIQRALGRPTTNYFSSFWALKGVSLDVFRGETVGIVGRNGSGKSSLLQIICGTLTPTGGEVSTNGRIAALLELGAGFNPEFTGRENVYLNAAVLGLADEEVRRRFDEIADFADIGDFIERPTKTYSSGMLIRLAFAVAINVDPEILVVDEALSVGDELFQRKCFAKIEKIKERGATILFVSHSGGTVIELCDRAMLIDGGERLLVGDPKTVIEAYQKLLYSSVDKAADVRKSLMQSGDSIKNGAPGGQIAVIAESNNNDQLQEVFDENLKSSSEVSYAQRGAEIGEVAIYIEPNKRVNILVSGNTYVCRYKVSFHDAASGVRFGMLIKTTTGIALGGGISASSLASSVSYIESGSEVEVSFRFDCYLNPGVYFMNSGVLGIINGEETFLHRKIDTVVFRVLPNPRSLSTETVNFNIKAEVVIK